MELAQSIQQYASYPIPHHLLAGLLKEYRKPNEKIRHLIKEGVLEPVKRGLYIAGPKISTLRPEPFLIANHILGPSYVSLESALSFHGLIPEQVYEISSVTTKATRKFATPLGIYSYTRLPLPYYSFGIRSVETGTQQRFLIASPEKALFDKIITTAGVEFRSRRSVVDNMENDLRIEMDSLKDLDIQSVENWVSTKIGVDKRPPMGFDTEEKLLIQPFSFYVRCFSLPDLFAGKMHALVFRRWQNNVKSRDWYDMEWYIKKDVPLKLSHFVARAVATGDWRKSTMTEDEFRGLLAKYFHDLAKELKIDSGK